MDNTLEMRITTDDGAGIEHSGKKLRGISTTVNEKVQDKNIKMSDVRLSEKGKEAIRKRSHHNAPPESEKYD